jgi:hypothetical protein
MPIHNVISRVSERRPRELQDVHFHQGPQGRPVPCYDTVCEVPRMSSGDIREAAVHAASER